jgi:uncharacterized membrane protein
MSPSAERLWTALRDAGLVQGAAPAMEAAETPWFVKVLLAFSGWLAALFLLGFLGLGLAFLVESGTASLITGSVLIGAAFALLRVPKNEFVEHLALAMSLAGQLLVATAIWRFVGGHDSLVWWLVALFQALLAALMPNFVHRVFSAFVSALSVAIALALMRMPYLFSGVILLPAAWLWLNEFRFPRQLKIMQAVGYGLVLALIPLEGATALGFGNLHWYATEKALPWVKPWMGELLAAGVLLYVVWSLLQRLGQRLSGRVVAFALAGTAILGVASMAAKGITVGIVILLLGFAGGNRVLLGLGVASLLFYSSSYYYTLEATLLTKAQTLFIVGLVLLAARWLMLRLLPAGPEEKHD